MSGRSAFLLSPLLAVWLSLPFFAQNPQNPVVVMETSKGTIEIELFPDRAPQAVNNFLRYVDEGFYRDTIFHRVIGGTLIQGGGFTPDLHEKPTHEPVPIESDNGLLNLRGAVAMARAEDKNSARSQFYINVSDNPEFDRSPTRWGYTVFGRVVDGMEVVDRISRVQASRRGGFDDIPILPVLIESVERK